MALEMVIRGTKSSDYAAIYKLLEAEDMTFEAFTPELFSNLLRRNRGYYFVAEANGKVVGSIFSTHDGGYCAYIYKLAVDRNFRRSGVASRLLQKVLGVLKEVPWIFAHVKKTNTVSLMLLKKFGLIMHNKYGLVYIYKGND